MTHEECSPLPLPDRFIFSNEQVIAICETSAVIACDCPAHLAGLLWEARRFYHYTMDCIDRYPEDAEDHRWLGEKILLVDALLSQILADFLQRKGLLNEQWQINLKLLKQHQIEAICKQHQQ